MRIARRYIASEIYRSSAVVLLALIALFSFFNLIDDLDKISEKVSLLNLLNLQLLSIPTQLYELLPIGLLIGSVLALAGLAQRNELVMLRVAGISGLQLLLALWVITIPLMAGAFVLSEYVTPKAEMQVNESSLEVFGRAGGGRLKSGYWFKESDANTPMRIINIGKLTDKSTVQEITVYEFDEHQHLNTFIQAPNGRFIDNKLLLSGAQRSHIAPNALDALDAVEALDLNSFNIPLITLENLSELKINTTLNAERLLARILTPERMAITDLMDYLDYLDANQLQTDRQAVALWRKIAYPFTLLVMITIAAPISFMQTRQGGMGSKVFLGIIIGVGFFMANQLALNLGMLSQWQPWITALLPSLLALTLALAALAIIENRHHWPRRQQQYTQDTHAKP